MDIVDAPHQGGMLGGSLRVSVVDASEEIRILAGIPLMREARAHCVSFTETVIEFDVEGLLVERTRARGHPVVIWVVSRRPDSQVGVGKRADQFSTDRIDQVAGPRRQIAQAERYG